MSFVEREYYTFKLFVLPEIKSVNKNTKKAMIIKNNTLNNFNGNGLGVKL